MFKICIKKHKIQRKSKHIIKLIIDIFDTELFT